MFTPISKCSYFVTFYLLIGGSAWGSTRFFTGKRIGVRFCKIFPVAVNYFCFSKWPLPTPISRNEVPLIVIYHHLAIALNDVSITNLDVSWKTTTGISSFDAILKPAPSCSNGVSLGSSGLIIHSCWQEEAVRLEGALVNHETWQGGCRL